MVIQFHELHIDKYDNKPVNVYKNIIGVDCHRQNEDEWV